MNVEERKTELEAVARSAITGPVVPALVADVGDGKGWYTVTCQ